MSAARILTWEELRETFFKMLLEKVEKPEIMAYFHNLFNIVLFKTQLWSVDFRVTTNENFLGCFRYDEPDGDAIILDVEAFEGWEPFSGTMLHEMCHQMQRLVEGARDEPMHGPVFMKWAEICGLEPEPDDESEEPALATPLNEAQPDPEPS